MPCEPSAANVPSRGRPADESLSLESSSFRTARTSILRTHSRVTPSRRPISLRVNGVSPSRPYRSTRIVRSRTSRHSSRARKISHSSPFSSKAWGESSRSSDPSTVRQSVPNAILLSSLSWRAWSAFANKDFWVSLRLSCDATSLKAGRTAQLATERLARSASTWSTARPCGRASESSTSC